MPVSISVVTTQIVFVRIFHLFHDDHPGMRLGARRRQNHVAVRRGIAARLAQHSFTQAVSVRCEVGHLLEHGFAGHVEHAAGDHASRLAAGVEVHRRHHIRDSHHASFRSIRS